MAQVTVKEGGKEGADYATLGTAVENPESDILIASTWTAVDSDEVENGETITTGGATTIAVAASARNINGYPGRAGNAYQLNATGSGHVFTIGGAGHDLSISDMDILSDSTTVSDEIFRIGDNEVDITCKRCHIGFSGNTNQQDILYYEGDNDTVTFSFESCMFYDVGRSIVDAFNIQTTILVVNFNGCDSLNIGVNGARNNGSWVGITGTSTVTVNAFTCLISCDDVAAFSADVAATLNVNADYCLTNLTQVNLSENEDSQNDTGSGWSYTWADDGDPGAGNFVVINDKDVSPYDQRLDDVTNNDAKDFHSIETGPDSGLALPSDILGTVRGAAEDHDVGAFEIVAVVTTVAPTTLAPTTVVPTTVAPTTLAPTTVAPTTLAPTTVAPTTLAPTTIAPTTVAPTTLAPTTIAPTTPVPTTPVPTTPVPTTPVPTTPIPTTPVPTTPSPTTAVPTTPAPTTLAPTTIAPTTAAPTTAVPTTPVPTTPSPTTPAPTTVVPTTLIPTTPVPTTAGPTTAPPTTIAPTTILVTTLPPTTVIPTTIIPTTAPPVVGLRRGIKNLGLSMRSWWRM